MSFKIIISGILFLLLSVFCTVLQADYSRVIDLINNGEPGEAQSELGRLLAGSFIDQEGAYLKGTVEPNGEVSVSELEKSLLLCMDDCEGTISRLAAAYYSYGDYQKVIDLYEKYDDKLDDRQASFGAFWFGSLAFMKAGDLDKAEDVIKKAEKAGGEKSLWADLMRADYRYLKDKKDDARKDLSEIISAGGLPGFAALLNQTYFYARDNKMDRAITGFTMLKDQHDDFLGSAEILQLMQGKGSMKSDASSEKIAGVRYTIQIGTYADKSEMQTLNNRLKKEGWSTFLKSKFVDGREYWTLSVGSFTTVERAQHSREILEGKLKTALKVVLLD
jgi:tetratricopeptide (TPR) repeat protein